MPRKKRIRHDWLPVDDPANVDKGYWVPHPSEIEFRCESIKAENLRRSLDEDTRFCFDARYAEPSDRVFVPPIVFPNRSPKEMKLCDCPYWGTEFQEFNKNA